MAIQKRARLKTYFEAGDTPAQRDFEDLLDSTFIKGEDGISFSQDDRGTRIGINSNVSKHPLTVSGSDTGVLIQSDGAHRPQLEFLSGDRASLVVSATPDYGAIGTPENADQYLTFRKGRTGVNTTTPAATLDVNGTLKLQKGISADEIADTMAAPTAIPTVKAVQEYISTMFVGVVSAFAGAIPPDGWLECAGQIVSRTEYSRLFARIKTQYGAGDGANTFQLPNLCGEFIRGWDHGRGVDANRQLGSLQSQQFETHTHGGGAHTHNYMDIYWSEAWGSVSGGLAGNKGDQDGDNRGYEMGRTTDSASIITSGPINGSFGNETRPRNVALMYCIKY